MKLESQDRIERPDLYALRDEIAKYGVPVSSANVLAREIYTLKQTVQGQQTQIGNLEQRLATLEAGTPPAKMRATINGHVAGPAGRP